MNVSFLPSLFTLFSLFIGFLALLQIMKGNFIKAIYFITGCVILDGFDGTVARLTKTESHFGLNLDSLVDAVAFGGVISVMIYLWGFKNDFRQIGMVIGFIFLSAGVIRLARFNVLKEIKDSAANVFIGLPIPLAALSICSVILLWEKPLKEGIEVILFSLFVILIALLMVSNIKYRTLKKLDSRYNLLILLLLAIMVAVLINFPTTTIPVMTCLYLISPILFFFAGKLKKEKHVSSTDTGVSLTGKKGKE